MLEVAEQSGDYTTSNYVKDLATAEKICSGQTRCCFESAKKLTASPCCCVCAKKRQSSALASFGICILVLLYTIMGAFIFLTLEGSSNTVKEDDAVAASKPNLSSDGFEMRSKVVERLWSITEDLNILYKENWTKLAAKELLEFQKMLADDLSDARDAHRSRWTFSNSFLYSLTLITTIGCGSFTPRTSIGKLASVIYACIGIPLVLFYLSSVGSAFSKGFRALYSKLRPEPEYQEIEYTACPYNSKNFNEMNDRSIDRQLKQNAIAAYRHRHWVCRDHTRVPLYFTILFMSCYIGLGTLVFKQTERWSYLDGCYFSFLSLSTIGLGTLTPGEYASTKSSQMVDIAVGFCCCYIFLGVIVIGVGFNLIQEEVKLLSKDIANFCSGTVKSRAIHAGKECTCEKGLESGS